MPKNDHKPHDVHLTPLKLAALNEYWSYNEGKRQFNLKLYEEILIEKQKENNNI